MEQLNRKSILDMVNGAIKERVDYEMGKVMENILDPNTDAVKPRKLTVTVELRADNERRSIGVKTVAKSTLVPTNALVTMLYVTNDQNGEMAVVEAVPQVPGQTALGGEEQEEPKVLNFYQKRA